MIPVPAAMQTALEGGATHHAWCWRVTRRDGAAFGFTDHDAPILFDGLTHAPQTGFSPGETRRALGADASELSLFGAIDDDRLVAADIDDGLWDGAEVRVFRVDWRDPAERVQTFRGEIAAVARRGAAFEADVTGLSARLNRRIGRSLGRACDALLGDTRCGKDISAAPYRIEATVAGGDTHGLTVEAPDAPAEPGWFAGGLLGVDGRDHLIEGDRLEGPRRRLSFAGAVPALAPGSGIVLSAGCDKTFASCLTKFSNQANFRGFPHMPGDDLLLRRAADEPLRDGGSRNA